MYEDDYGTYDQNGKLTPYGLAVWMDNEGGLAGLFHRNGPETFIEAGCSPYIVYKYAEAVKAMETELERIGAIL